MLRVTRFDKQFGCGHTPKFLQGAGPAKMLVGELPKPAVLRDKLSQVQVRCTIVCGPPLSFLGLIFTLVCYAEQMINVCFYCNGLPHLPLGFPVFCIKLFLLSRQLTAGFF